MENNNHNEKPRHLFVLKCVGFAALGIGLIGIILSISGFGNFENNNFMTGGILTCLGAFVGIPCLFMGFRPEIIKMTTKTTKYIQNDNKDDFTDIASTTADITSDAITTVTKSIKKGLNEEDKPNIFCKHCGQDIDTDSTFCKHCGKKQ